jgi:hypothetical protein
MPANPDGSEAAWPEADVIIAIRPFWGDNMMRGDLVDAYVDTSEALKRPRPPVVRSVDLLVRESPCANRVGSRKRRQDGRHQYQPPEAQPRRPGADNHHHPHL